MTCPHSNHDLLDELLALEALSALDPDQRTRLDELVDEHGPDCTTISQARRRYTALVEELADSLEPAPVTPTLRHRVLDSIDDNTQHLAPSTQPAEPALAQHPRPVRSWRRWVPRAAIAVALVVVGAVGGFAVGHPRDGTSAQFAAFVSQPDVRVITFDTAGRGTLAVALRSGDPVAWTVASALAPPPSGKVYQLWYRAPGETAMRSAGTFRPDGSGAVVEETRILSAADLLAVTLEPAGGSPQPTSAPLFQATG